MNQIFAKSDLICAQCTKILSNPIHLPCYCSICLTHLSDDSVVEKGEITCVKCAVSFPLENLSYKEHKLAKIILSANAHLTHAEKKLHNEVQVIFDEFDSLYEGFLQDQTLCEQACDQKFGEIQRQIEAQRLNLAQKIDEINTSEIERATENERYFKNKIKDLVDVCLFDADLERKRLDDKFRKVNMTAEEVTQFQDESETHLDGLRERIKGLERAQDRFKACSFEVNEVPLGVNFFGALTLRKFENSQLVSSSSDNTIKIWDLTTNECIRTLMGHNDSVRCLEIVPVPGHLKQNENAENLAKK